MRLALNTTTMLEPPNSHMDRSVQKQQSAFNGCSRLGRFDTSMPSPPSRNPASTSARPPLLHWPRARAAPSLGGGNPFPATNGSAPVGQFAGRPAAPAANIAASQHRGDRSTADRATRRHRSCCREQRWMARLRSLVQQQNALATCHATRRAACGKQTTRTHSANTALQQAGNSTLDTHARTLATRGQDRRLEEVLCTIATECHGAQDTPLKPSTTLCPPARRASSWVNAVWLPRALIAESAYHGQQR